MYFDNPLFYVSLLIGAIIFFTGTFMRKNPPKKINGMYGYRTPSSMKSKERWDFAQLYSAIRMEKSGIFMALVSVIGLVVKIDLIAGALISVFIMGCIFVFLMITTERAIKKKFGDK